MSITYKKYDDYYVFSNCLKTRVYLGDASPEDYIWDIEQQAIRSASSWYKEIHTGKDVTWDDIMDYDHDGSKPGNGSVFYGPESDWQKRENYTFEGGHTYDFVRRLSCSSFSSPTKNCSYVTKDKAAARLAQAYYYNQSLEQYDAQQAGYTKERKERAKNEPWLHNLMWITTDKGNEMYYVDDESNRITTEEHETNMKLKFGDDVFDTAKKNNPVDPAVEKIVEEIIAIRTGKMSLFPRLELPNKD